MSAQQQEIRFCTSADGARIAFATVGEGPPLVKAANWLSHLEFDWNSPVWRHWLRELSRCNTLIRYDERGCGLSDRDVEDFTLDAWVRDLEAVVDALGLERFPLLGISQGGPIAIAYAIRHPERVSHLILYGSYARGRGHRQLSDRERQEGQLLLQLIEVGWGKDHPAFRQVFTSMFIPDATPEQTTWFNELQRVSTSPENAIRMLRGFYALDVYDLASQLRVPTLVMHGTGDLRVPFGEGRLLASLIPGARLIPLDSRNHVLLESEPAWHRFVTEVREFLGVAPLTPGSGGDSTGSARRREVETIFVRALELTPQERPSFLSGACGTDAELRREVEELLYGAEASGVTRRLFGVVARQAGRRPDTIGRYRIVEHLGVGGMGVVYKARDDRLARTVAIKVLAPFLDADAALRDRFLREARAAAALDHPNICSVYETGQTPDDRLFIVMPFYDGGTLTTRLANGPLPVGAALEYAAQVADGLAHAHAAGVVHRDIKPANLAITAADRVKILDFGIAKVADAQRTRSGMVLGTPAYMSPEQASGQDVDPRTDLWSLGVVLYEMLAGQRPFRGDTSQAILYAIHHESPPLVDTLRPEASAQVAGIVERLLRRRREERYGTADVVAADLRRAVSAA
ncbi:MAG TPA: alpha/beta fold hydrolase [Gemmatimonadaceae bacterium]|nr:alpha/beta fold hydrolase [Gemmatimonadaceae bacterium]